jgi:cbb3-type cytochrome oxidase maturation protein
MGRLMAMLFGLWVVVGWMAFVMLSGLAFIAWGLKSGQFDDVEEPKYRMLEDHDPADWPDKPSGKGGTGRA